MPRTKQQKPRHIAETEKANEAPSSSIAESSKYISEKQIPATTKMVETDEVSSCNNTCDQRQCDVISKDRLTDSPQSLPGASVSPHLMKHQQNTENSIHKKLDLPSFFETNLNKSPVAKSETNLNPSSLVNVKQPSSPFQHQPVESENQFDTTSNLNKLTVKNDQETAKTCESLKRKDSVDHNTANRPPYIGSQSTNYADAASKYMENLRLLMGQGPTPTMFNKPLPDYARDYALHNQVTSFNNKGVHPQTVNYYLSELTERWNQIMLQQLSKVPGQNLLDGSNSPNLKPNHAGSGQHHSTLGIPYPNAPKISPNPISTEQQPVDLKVEHIRQNYEPTSHFNQFQPWPAHQRWLDYQASLAKFTPGMHGVAPPLNLPENQDRKLRTDLHSSSLSTDIYSPRPKTNSPLSKSRRQSEVKFDGDFLNRKHLDIPTSIYPSSSMLSSPAPNSGNNSQNLVSPGMQNLFSLPTYSSLSPQSAGDFTRDPYFSTSGKIPPVKKSRSRGQPIDNIHAAIVREAKEQFKGLDPENMYIQCPICQKRIKRLYHFQRHMRIHTGEKTHHCKYCQYKSVRKDNLKSHMKTHNKQNVDTNRRPGKSTTSSHHQEREKASRNVYTNKEEISSYSYSDSSNSSTILGEAHGSPLNLANANKFPPSYMPYPCFPTFNTFTQKFYSTQGSSGIRDISDLTKDEPKLKENQRTTENVTFHDTETKINGESSIVMSTTSPKLAGFGHSPGRQTFESNLGVVSNRLTKRDSKVLESTHTELNTEVEVSKKTKLSTNIVSGLIRAGDKNDFTTKSNENTNNNNKQTAIHVGLSSVNQTTNQNDQKIDLFANRRKLSVIESGQFYKRSPISKTTDSESPNYYKSPFQIEKFQEFLPIKKQDLESNSERSVASSNSLTPDEFNKESPRSQLSSTSSDDEYSNHNNVSQWQDQPCNNVVTSGSERPLYLLTPYNKNDNAPAKNGEMIKDLVMRKDSISNSIVSGTSENSPLPSSVGEINFTTEREINKEFSCRLCKFTFNSNVDLQGHMSLNHKQDGFYKCSECIYLGKNLSKLVEHIRIHTGERPFKCDQCNYAAKRKDNLAQHKAVRHDKRKGKPSGLYPVYDQNSASELQQLDFRKLSTERSPIVQHKKSIDYPQFSKFPFDSNFSAFSKNHLNRCDLESMPSPTGPLTPPFQMFNPVMQPRSPTMLHYPFFVPPSIIHPLGLNSVLNGVGSTNGSERISGRYSLNVRAALI